MLDNFKRRKHTEGHLPHMVCNCKPMRFPNTVTALSLSQSSESVGTPVYLN